jgi:hypothetical protein
VLFFSLFAKRIYKSEEFVQIWLFDLESIRHEASLSCCRHNLEGSQCDIFRTKVRHVVCNVKRCSINELKAGSVTRVYHCSKKSYFLSFMNKWTDRKSVPTMMMCAYNDDVCLLHGVPVHSVNWWVRYETLLLKA